MRMRSFREEVDEKNTPKSSKGLLQKQIPTQENDDGVNMSPKRLWLLGVQREANSIGSVEVTKQPLADQRQEGDDEAEHPNPEEDADSSSPSGCQVAERVDDTDVFLQSEVSEQKDRHLSGQHGQGADDLTLTAVHPGLCVPVVLAAELQIIRADHEKVDSHQPVCTCKEEELKIRKCSDCKDKSY